MDQSGDREERTPPPFKRHRTTMTANFVSSFSHFLRELLALVARVSSRPDHRAKSKRAILSPFTIEDRKRLADLYNDA